MGTATYTPHRTASIVPLLVLLTLAAGVLTLPRTLPHISAESIPLSRHAEKSHQKDLTCAKDIQRRIDRGDCKSLNCYHCEAEGTVKAICQLSTHVFGGLVLSEALDLTITGFPARGSYWHNNVAGCTPIACPFLP